MDTSLRCAFTSRLLLSSMAAKTFIVCMPRSSYHTARSILTLPIFHSRVHCFSCPSPAACNVAASMVLANVDRTFPSSIRIRPAMVHPPGAIAEQAISQGSDRSSRWLEVGQCTRWILGSVQTEMRNKARKRAYW